MIFITRIISAVMAVIMALVTLNGTVTKSSDSPASDNYPYTLEDMSVVYDNVDENGNYYEFESLKLPKGYIKGTVGAGDAFCAGVLYAAETDMPLPEALKLGACSAAASLSEVSASDGVKAKDEVLNLYELYGKK